MRDPTDIVRDVVVVGAGESGSAFLRARGATSDRTLVIEHRPAPAAGPAQTGNGAIGRAQAPLERSDIEIWWESTAVGLKVDKSGWPALTVAREQGPIVVTARWVVLCCGCMERTRELDAIPGTRPAGIGTPAFAHALLDRDLVPGHRGVMAGPPETIARLAPRLRDAGCTVTEVLEPSRVTHVFGSFRLERVRIAEPDGERLVHADFLIYTSGAIADTDWLRHSGVQLRREDGAVVVDDLCRTSVRGVYAFGTVTAPDLGHRQSGADGARAASVAHRWSERG